ncbi:MAG: hypothetical protein CMM00_09990, partial [Rhodopirellula sp.]|nr:hypothetical protein [Rhodopirellula sp.]
IEGLTFRKLAAVDLDRFATDAEQAAAVRLDELDRERSGKPSRSVNARNGSAPNAIDEPQNRERAPASHAGRRSRDAENVRNCEQINPMFQRIPSGKRGTRAFDRKRAELVEALGVEVQHR